MTAQSQQSPLAGFGPNEWLVDEIYQQYLPDKDSVNPAWWEFFEDYSPATARGHLGQRRRAHRATRGSSHRDSGARAAATPAAAAARRRHARRTCGTRSRRPAATPSAPAAPARSGSAAALALPAADAGRSPRQSC